MLIHLADTCSYVMKYLLPIGVVTTFNVATRCTYPQTMDHDKGCTVKKRATVMTCNNVVWSMITDRLKTLMNIRFTIAIQPGPIFVTHEYLTNKHKAKIPTCTIQSLNKISNGIQHSIAIKLYVCCAFVFI